MGLIGTTLPIPLPNNAPTWTGTPDPNFVAGLGGVYDLINLTFDQEDDSLTFSLNAGSDPLPSWLALVGSQFIATSDCVEGTTPDITVDVKDATSALVPSPTMIIRITASQPLAAFPGAQGFGTETTHGRGGIVVQVTNLNDNGAGSLREALTTEVPRIIIYRVSGTIYLDSPIKMGGEHSDVGIFGQTAPGGGICIAASASNGESLVQVSNLNVEDNNIDECHDVVFQHIRFRHGARDRTSLPNQDCFVAYAGTYNLVIDHCSLSWTSDETISMWNNNNDDASILTMYDITISHSIIAEGDQTHNTGVLFSGGDLDGKKIHNVSYHHNLSAHLQYRDIMVDTGSGDSTKGVQCINNVHYDVPGSHHSLGQNQYNESQTFFDSINECFIRSSRETVDNGRPVYNVNRIYTLTGSSWQQTDDQIFHPVSIYGSGNIYREVDLTQVSGKAAGEADNELWVNKQYVGLTSGGGPYDDGETYDWRTSQFSTQPDNPVTVTTALQAYTDLITDGDCGAVPHDSVDARIVASVIDGTVYSRYNVPGYPGSSATWPTLTDTGAPTDTSGNGLPDSYQVGVLGKSAADAYNPANTFTVGNGYSDIENWIHTL